jgi:hypothetical protein
VVRAWGLRKSRSALGRLRLWLVVELVMNGIAVVWLGSFLVAHFTEPRFVLCALLLDAAAIAQLIGTTRQLVGLHRIDLDGPLVPCQRKLEEVRVERIRLTVATLLAGPLLWIPLLAVVLEAGFAVDAFRVFSTAWLVVNGLVGAAFVPLMLLLARRYAGRSVGSPFVRRLLRDLAGYNLSAAQAFLSELADVDPT